MHTVFLQRLPLFPAAVAAAPDGSCTMHFLPLRLSLSSVTSNFFLTHMRERDVRPDGPSDRQSGSCL